MLLVSGSVQMQWLMKTDKAMAVPVNIAPIIIALLYSINAVETIVQSVCIIQ